MIYKRGDSVVIKRGDKFIESRIVNVVKPYQRKSYYLNSEVRYFCLVKSGKLSYEIMTQVHSETELINWCKQSSRTDKLNELGI